MSAFRIINHCVNSPFGFGQILLKTNKWVNSSAGHCDCRTVELELASDVSISDSSKGSTAWSLCPSWVSVSVAAVCSLSRLLLYVDFY